MCIPNRLIYIFIIYLQITNIYCLLFFIEAATYIVAHSIGFSGKEMNLNSALSLTSILKYLHPVISDFGSSMFNET